MMKKVKLLLCLLLCLLLLGACAERTTLCEKNIYAMDTVVTLRLSTDSTTAQEAYEKASRLITRLEGVLSRTVDGSDCSAFNKETSLLCYPDDDFRSVLSEALRIAADTNGAYDPTVAPLTDMWRITDPQATGVPEDEELAEALSHVGYTGISVAEEQIEKADPLAKIDLGGVGKGYACGQVIDALVGMDIGYGMISFGGNVGVFGNKPDGEPFKISLRDPADAAGTVGTLSVGSGFVSVSGSYERYREVDGVRYHHIFDPATGRPAESGLLSVAVLSENGAQADALSTALFVMGADEAYAFYRNGTESFEAVLITEDGRVLLTDGLRDSFLLTNSNYRLDNIGEVS